MYSLVIPQKLAIDNTNLRKNKCECCVCMFFNTEVIIAFDVSEERNTVPRNLLFQIVSVRVSLVKHHAQIGQKKSDDMRSEYILCFPG
jgi:flagellar biosynthesis regulator FlaF